MKLGKIVNGELHLLPHVIIVNDMQVFNPIEEHAKAAGYKEIIDTAMPEEPAPEGQHYEAKYEDTGANITQIWYLVDNEEIPPQPPTIEERIQIVETDLSVMKTMSEPVMFVSEFTAQTFDDKTALKVKDIYPEWNSLCEQSYYAETKGYKFQYNGNLYKTIQDKFTFQSQWIPGQGTSSIYTQISEEQGTLENPIQVPADVETNPFAYVIGKYYIEDEVIYKCQRQGEADGTEHSFPYKPSQLLNQYFVKVETEKTFNWI